MKLTDAQLIVVREAWGDDSDRIVALLGKKKGRCNFFNEDGSLAKGKEEIEAALVAAPKKKAEKEAVAPKAVKTRKPGRPSKAADWRSAIKGLSYHELDEVIAFAHECKAVKKAEEISSLEARLRELKGE